MAETQSMNAGEPQAGVVPMRFEDIYLAYYKRVYNFIYSRLLHRENAEDVTADVFVSVHRNLSRLDLSRGTFNTWIFSIARNAVRDFKKRAAFRCEVLGSVPETFAPEESFPENGGRDNTLKNPDNIWLQQLLQQLTEEEGDLLMYRYQMSLSNAEVGEILDISVEAVSARYQRLLKKCRQMSRQMEQASGRLWQGDS